ncbi:MAG: hypothetical protein ACR2QV_12055 [Gammaproteobacteria bacterium]
MAVELYVLSENPGLDADGLGRVRIGVTDSGDRPRAPLKNENSRPMSLVFTALFRRDSEGSEWEQRLNKRLQESGVKVGDEFFFVGDTMVESLCDAAAHADGHEWIVPPADPEYVRLAMELGYARRRVRETFDAWCQCGRASNAEIRIGAHEQYMARGEKRLRELEGSYVKPRFYNDGATKNAQTDYAIYRLRDEVRKRRTEINRLRRLVDDGDFAFDEWTSAVQRVSELEKQLAGISAARRDDEPDAG